jgi:hypothetical protein
MHDCFTKREVSLGSGEIIGFVCTHLTFLNHYAFVRLQIRLWFYGESGLLSKYPDHTMKTNA